MEPFEPPSGHAGAGPTPDDPGARVRAVLRVGVPFAALMVLASVLAAGPLQGEEVVLHRGFDGEPTRTGDATELLVLMPVLGVFQLGVLALAAYGTRPGDARPAPSPGVMGALTAVVLGLFLAIQLVLLGDALGWVAEPFLWVMGLVGAGFTLGGWLMTWSRTIDRAAVLVNLPLPPDADARRRVVRTCGRGMLWTGIATLVALLGPKWLPVAVLVAGSILLVPLSLGAASRAR